MAFCGRLTNSDSDLSDFSRFKRVREFFNEQLPKKSRRVKTPPGVSKLTRNSAHKIFHLLEHETLDKRQQHEIRALLSRCPKSENVLTPLDDQVKKKQIF